MRPVGPGVSGAEVEGVVEQFAPVGADVEHDREGAGRVDAGGGGVHGELAHRDLHPAHAPVPDAENRLRIGRHDEVHVLGARAWGAQRALDVLGRVHRQIDPAQAAVFVAVLLDRGAHCRCVDDRQHLGEVVGDQPKEQHLVAVVQRAQVHVLREVTGLCAELGVRAG